MAVGVRRDRTVLGHPKIPNLAPQGLGNLRQQAIEQALSRIDLVGIPPSFQAAANYQTRLNALSWRIDPVAATEIECRLASYGFDQDAINAEVYAQARELFLMFESLLVSTQNRRTILLREIDNHRHAKASCNYHPNRSLSRSASLNRSPPTGEET
jgi:hypothetical protein